MLDILDTVAASTKPLSVTEINDVRDLPKATAYRICARLEARGYLLKRIDGKSNQLGNRLFEVGETCNIAYPDGLYMAYSDRVETKAPLRLQFPIGSRVPLYCTASGKLFLSTLRKSRRTAVIGKLKLEAHAKNTITNADVLLAEIDNIERQQFSIDNQELYDDVIAIAVPIKDKQGRFYSSLAIQAPLSRISINQSERYPPMLREAADDLAKLAEDE